MNDNYDEFIAYLPDDDYVDENSTEYQELEDRYNATYNSIFGEAHEHL